MSTIEALYEPGILMKCLHSLMNMFTETIIIMIIIIMIIIIIIIIIYFKRPLS